MFQIRDLMADIQRFVGIPDSVLPHFAADGSALDTEISADREQLFRVFSNLALNAAQAGATTVRIDVERVDSLVIFEVRDDGSGIPAKIRERLFLPFAGSGRGTGLGLVIAHEIIAAHGGAFSLVNTGADGTTFRISLPLRPARSRPS
jgi:signal transduction histidine kinase